jgi:hypothetical protein
MKEQELEPYLKKKVRATLATISGERVWDGEILKYKKELVFRTLTHGSIWYAHEIKSLTELS